MAPIRESRLPVQEQPVENESIPVEAAFLPVAVKQKRGGDFQKTVHLPGRVEREAQRGRRERDKPAGEAC